MFRYSVAAILSMLLIAFPAAAETRIGVVDLRQALFSSSDARAFSETLQKDFAGEEAKVREAADGRKDVNVRAERRLARCVNPYGGFSAAVPCRSDSDGGA